MAIYVGSKAMPETLNRTPIAIVDEDQSAASSRIAGAFYLPYFMPPRRISQPERNLRMDAGLDTFALDIPPNFQRELLAGRSPAILLNIDATRMVVVARFYILAAGLELAGRAQQKTASTATQP